jgi:hypothetical protein
MIYSSKIGDFDYFAIIKQLFNRKALIKWFFIKIALLNYISWYILQKSEILIILQFYSYNLIEKQELDDYPSK